MTTQITNETSGPRNVVQIKELQGASRHLNVVPDEGMEGRYFVESGTRRGLFYMVTLEPDALRGSCTCAWAQHGGTNCKHILAALRARYAPHGGISFWINPSDARRQHRHMMRGERLIATLRNRG